MRVLSLLIFDDVIPSTTTVYTSAEFYSVLGRCDAIAIQAIVDGIDANGTFTCQLQHSADAKNWINKSGTAEINAGSISTGTTNVLQGADDGVTPSLANIRFALTFATTTSGHVKLYATARDKSSGAAAQGR